MNSLYDIRWHDKSSACLGSIVLETDETGALEFAIGKLAKIRVHSVRIRLGSNCVFSLKRGDHR